MPKPTSEPIKEDKDKKQKNEKKTKDLKSSPIEIEATGTITAGSMVAEMDTANIRKTKLRT